MKERTYTTEEIRAYMEGWKIANGDGKPIHQANTALGYAIQFLECEEDGIGAVTQRDRDGR